MTSQEDVRDPSICMRKERRYRASDESSLKCETTLAQCALRRGTVIDISASGLRLLCEGSFEAGQAIFAELTTDRSHGIYRGTIRRVEPWTGGQSILGCSLEEPIPENVLQDLANDGAINRRSDERVELSRSAKLTWPLSRKEVDVELKEFSQGGLRIMSSAPIPDDVRLRFRVQCAEAGELVVEAQSVWVESRDDGCVAGVVFTHGDTPSQVAEVLGIGPTQEESQTPRNRSIQLWRDLALGAGIATVFYLGLMLI